MEFNEMVTGEAIDFQALPSQLRITPPSPTAQALLELTVATERIVARLGLVVVIQVLPFQRSKSVVPTAQPSFGESISTPIKLPVVGLGVTGALHALPFQRNKVPLLPTAQPSLAEIKFTPRRARFTGVVGCMPSNCQVAFVVTLKRRASSPAAKIVVLEGAATAYNVLVLGPATAVQAVPSHLRIVPLLPTAQP